MSTQELLAQLKQGDRRALARCISIVENEREGAQEILTGLDFSHPAPIVGITGPPGAGKSTLINGLITQLLAQNKKVAVIAVDPTSPFNFGSLLGDRLRMSEHFTNENVFIRSLATRGSLGGLSAKAIEIGDLVRNAGFDVVIFETVGVGQSEVEIAGLADTTMLVLVPEAGDEVQTLKSGVMEIADIFVVNKADRPGANTFVKNLSQLLHERPLGDWRTPIVKTAASKNEGVDELLAQIEAHGKVSKDHSRRSWLLAEKAYRLIQDARMKDIPKSVLREQLEKNLQQGPFNLYAFVRQFLQR